jgi:hypothetical protein
MEKRLNKIQYKQNSIGDIHSTTKNQKHSNRPLQNPNSRTPKIEGSKEERHSKGITKYNELK